MPNIEALLILGFFLVGLGAITATGIITWRFVGSFTRLVDQNARTMAVTAAIAEKTSRQHDEVVAAMEYLTEQHGEIVKAIERLTEKIKAMVDGR
jgi:hypothetical protein